MPLKKTPDSNIISFPRRKGAQPKNAPESKILETIEKSLPNGWSCEGITSKNEAKLLQNETDNYTVDLGETRNPFIASGIVNTWIDTRACA